jgi:predicted nucleic acid-binding Zn ribbon protein
VPDTVEPIECVDCGAAVDVDDVGNDASMVVCPNCGRQYGTWGELKKAITDEAGKAIAKALKL